VCTVVSCLVCIVVSCLVCFVDSCLVCIVVVVLCVLFLVVLCVLLLVVLFVLLLVVLCVLLLVVLCVLLSPYVYLLYCMCIAVFTFDAGPLARSQYPEGPATGHFDTGFSRFPCVYKQTLRRFPTFQVATTCPLFSPPELNLLVTNFIFYIHVK
jgi:hypothetical protein